MQAAFRRRLHDADMSSFADPGNVLAQLEAADRILIQQVFRPIGNEYRISLPAAGSSEEGVPLLFVKQKKLAVREDIRFRLDPDADAFLFMIKAKSVFEVRGRYAVTDANETVLGSLEKSFAKSLIRSHWVVRDADGAELFTAQEDSLVIALVRRFVEFIPYVGSIGFFLQWLPFNFSLDRGTTKLASFQRILGKLRDRYVLEVTEEGRAIDRRLLVAFAVGLDTLQNR